MAKEETDPWVAQIKVVDQLCSEEAVNVANQFNMRQIKRFAQAEMLDYYLKRYCYRLDDKQIDEVLSPPGRMLQAYKTLLKANKGWAIKLAAKVASVGGQARMLLNLQRVKEKLIGHE